VFPATSARDKMPVLEFPDPEDTDEDGLLAIGGDLHPESLRLAYRSGIFPWPHTGMPLLWFSPPKRAILDFAHLHVPHRLARLMRQCPFQITIDQAFERVILACQSAVRPGQSSTWITAEMVTGYREAHALGFAHSIESWDEHGNLVGGLYGMDCGGVFAGESMFYLQPNASKLALLYLIGHLRERGSDFLDIQMMTPHLAALGAEVIDRAVFLRRLAATQRVGLRLF